jgi:50S ribosomal protein L16 3-hydroxylase
MASYATDGGGVGPHVDNYDVFLLQAHGRRRWRISRQRDLALQPGQPLQLLAGFRATQEWLLEPGDMLYLPPGVAHDGVADGECITWSIGFRAPAFQELLDPWLARFTEHASLPGRYTDPGQPPVTHPSVLPPAMIAQVHRALSRVRPTRADTERFLLEHLSEPKSQVVFARPPSPVSLAAFTRGAKRRGVSLDIRSRMLIGRADIALNGELLAMAHSLRPALRQLADQRTLEARSLSRSPAGLFALLHDFLRAGWLHLGPPG